MVIITVFFLSERRQNYYTVKIIIVFYGDQSDNYDFSFPESVIGDLSFKIMYRNFIYQHFYIFS